MYNISRIRTKANILYSSFPFMFKQYHTHATVRFCSIYMKSNTHILIITNENKIS